MALPGAGSKSVDRNIGDRSPVENLIADLAFRFFGSEGWVRSTHLKELSESLRLIGL
jgi:hypothetical protein